MCLRQEVIPLEMNKKRRNGYFLEGVIDLDGECVGFFLYDIDFYSFLSLNLDNPHIEMVMLTSLVMEN